ncbi:hypothetical protein XELAEV_18006957mg, partial [Xenopus laevis]
MWSVIGVMCVGLCKCYLVISAVNIMSVSQALVIKRPKPPQPLAFVAFKGEKLPKPRINKKQQGHRATVNLNPPLV